MTPAPAGGRRLLEGTRPLAREEVAVDEVGVRTSLRLRVQHHR